MDKLILTTAELQSLMQWKDNHKDLVRSMPAPFKAIEIHVESGFIIKGIRESSSLKLYLKYNGKPAGVAEFLVEEDGLVFNGKNTISPHEMLQDVLTTYCSLMALITYGKPIEHERREILSSGPSQSTTKRTIHSVTYLLRSYKSGELQGHHASPRGVFGVRGHYRHYRNGRVIWIAAYKKGEGKQKSKTYKLGGQPDEHS